MASRSLLLLDDDEAFRTELADRIESEGTFRVTTATTIAEAETYVSAEGAHFDAMLLDVDLPDGNGRDLCAKLRKYGSRMPILMLTGCDDEVDVVRGLEVGANDYIAKPFRPGVLMARLRAQMRTWERHADALLSIGRYDFQSSSRTLRDASGKPQVVLTSMEAAILRYLYYRPGQFVSRQDLLNAVWHYTSGISTHTVETHIYRLRGKLEQDPANPCILLTRTGGYRLDPGR